MTVRLALLGAGRIGTIHGGNAAATPGAALVSVSDRDGDAAARLAGATGAAVRPLDEAIEREDVDAVLICAPTPAHAELIERAARAGKAIFCEKPIDLSVPRVVETLRVVEQAGVPLMIGFNRRFDPHIGELKRRLDAGVIGEPEIVTVLSRDPQPPPPEYVASSGGIYRDMMIHDFDMVRFLLGEEFVSVYATGSALVDPAIGAAGDVDTAAVQMMSASGRIVQISNSRRAVYGYDQRTEVHGSKGLLQVDNVRRSTLRLSGGEGQAADRPLDFFLDRYAESYRREMAAFIHAVASGDAPRPSGADGLAAQRLADAASESLATGNVVAL